MEVIRRSRASLFLLCALPFLAAAEPRQARPSAAETAAKVDAALLRGLASGVRLPGLADDATFLRRVSLDLTGKLPEPAALEGFVADTKSDKRANVVDE